MTKCVSSLPKCVFIETFPGERKSVFAFPTDKLVWYPDYGQTWIFCILKLEGDQWIYYESATRQLSREALTISNKAICEILLFILEWVSLYLEV